MEEFTIEKKDDGYHLYIPIYVHKRICEHMKRGEHRIMCSRCVWEEKTTRRHVGYFFEIDGELHFQFAGKSWRMGNGKKYEASCKKINMEKKTWIAINKDRKGREVAMCYRSPCLIAIPKVREMMIDDAIDDMLDKGKQ